MAKALASKARMLQVRVLPELLTGRPLGVALSQETSWVRVPPWQLGRRAEGKSRSRRITRFCKIPVIGLT